jgi:hypothetical protein
MIFFHEVGHVVCGHFNLDVPVHVQEYEADHFALLAAKLDGVMVPELWMTDTKTLLKDAIRNDIQDGHTIERHVLHWVS